MSCVAGQGTAGDGAWEYRKIRPKLRGLKGLISNTVYENLSKLSPLKTFVWKLGIKNIEKKLSSVCLLHVFALEQKQRHFGLKLKDTVTENPAEAEAAGEITTSSDDASDNISEGASSLKVCEQEEEQSGKEEVSSMLRLLVNAHIALPY